jgi:predicted nucleotidyltransferase
MINIEPQHLKIVENILKKYPYSFFVFGSRITAKARTFSDLDLCFFEDIPTKIQIQIEEDFEESDLPYKVDIVNWQSCNQELKNVISKNMKCLQEGPNHFTIDKIFNSH